MMRFPLALATALSLSALPAAAQDAQSLARDYVAMPEIQAMLTDMFSPETMEAQIIANLPPGITVTEDQQSQIGEVMSNALTSLRPRVEALMVSVSADMFTAPELEALIEFYGSEHGASVMNKMQPFMTRVVTEISPEMAEIQQSVAPDIIKIMQGGQ